ncbi:hypothetical protein V3N99_13145 [Dermatophilaceae bacterium Soc4.6]
MTPPGRPALGSAGRVVVAALVVWVATLVDARTRALTLAPG